MPNKNTEPRPPKCQTTIDEYLKKPTEVNPISFVKIVEVEEKNEEKGGLKVQGGQKKCSFKRGGPKFLARAKASTANEVIEDLRVRHVEAKLKIGLLTTIEGKIKKEVHLCKANANAMTKGVENSDNLQKIDFLGLGGGQ